LARASAFSAGAATPYSAAALASASAFVVASAAAFASAAALEMWNKMPTSQLLGGKNIS